MDEDAEGVELMSPRRRSISSVKSFVYDESDSFDRRDEKSREDSSE